MLYKSSAPGSLMILGEHAVLHGYPAVCAAIDKRVFVSIELNQKSIVKICSKGKPSTEQSLNSLVVEDNDYYKFVIASVKSVLEFIDIDTGFSISIDSEIDDTVGFGSSAAVVVATVSAILKSQGLDITDQELFLMAKQAIMYAQGGIGSCSDVAASICGGMISMCNYNFSKLSLPLPSFVVIYCGYKTKTTDVIRRVNEEIGLDKELIYSKMGECVNSFLHNTDVLSYGEFFTKYQEYFKSLKVTDSTIDSIITRLYDAGVHHCKISGSGLGDCVIGILPEGGFNKSIELFDKVRVMDVSLSNIGVVSSEQRAVYS